MNKYDRPEDLGYTYTWENMPRDEEGFIQLIPKHPIGKTDSFKRRFMYTDQPEIILHHGHISITNYKMGDNFEFEKSLSVWNKMTFRYELIGGYYISEYREFCINRGYDLQRLKNFFPDRPMRVVNDPFPSDPIDIELYAPPRSDFQKVALTFMTHQDIYSSIKHTQQIIDADTGDGKTYCGVATTAYWKHKVIIFVPFSKLLDQWKDAFTTFTSVNDYEIMIIQGSTACEKILAGKCHHIKVFICSMDTITSFQKKHGNLRTIELLKATGAYIKIIDEIHRDIRAVSMIEALSNFRLNYYMSASPGRAEQKENWIFRTLFKNVPQFGSTFKTQEEKHITVMIKKFKWTPDYKQIKAMVNNKTGLNIKAYERELINSPQFQRQSFDDAITVLLNWAKGVMKPGKRLMLMAQSIETLFYIQKLAEKVFPGETSVYYGGLSKKEKAAALEKKIIVATDSSLGTGANIPELQFLIYCSTYSNWLNARQLSGRLRKLNDGTQVVYIELLNVGYLKTMKQFDKRKGELQRRSKTGKLFFVE